MTDSSAIYSSGMLAPASTQSVDSTHQETPSDTIPFWVAGAGRNSAPQ